jgi:hypothetical protein
LTWMQATYVNPKLVQHVLVHSLFPTCHETCLNRHSCRIQNQLPMLLYMC